MKAAGIAIVSLRQSSREWKNKSVFSQLRTLTTWHCPHWPAARRYCSSRSISPARGLTHSNKPAAASLLLWAHAGTDRQTDGRTDGHRTVSQTLFRMLCGQCRYLYVNCCTTVETSYTANPQQIKVTELEGYSWPTCSKQPRLIDCRIGVVNKLDHRDRVDKKWRNFLSPEFPTKFPGEVYVFWRHPDFIITQYKIGQKVSVPKTGSIRPAVIIKTRTDRQTGGRTTTANAALA